MNFSPEPFAETVQRPPTFLSTAASLLRPGIVGICCLCLALGGCSKKGKAERELKQQSDAAGSKASVAQGPAKSTLEKALPVVSPGHLPPNPRMPPGSIITANASASRRWPVGPKPQVKPAAAKASTEKKATPAAFVPLAAARTPENSNQARLQALNEMFRLRRQREGPALQPPAGSATSNIPVSKPEKKVVPTKTQP